MVQITTQKQENVTALHFYCWSTKNSDLHFQKKVKQQWFLSTDSTLVWHYSLCVKIELLVVNTKLLLVKMAL